MLYLVCHPLTSTMIFSSYASFSLNALFWHNLFVHVVKLMVLELFTPLRFDRPYVYHNTIASPPPLV